MAKVTGRVNPDTWEEVPHPANSPETSERFRGNEMTFVKRVN